MENSPLAVQEIINKFNALSDEQKKLVLAWMPSELLADEVKIRLMAHERFYNNIREITLNSEG